MLSAHFNVTTPSEENSEKKPMKIMFQHHFLQDQKSVVVLFTVYRSNACLEFKYMYPDYDKEQKHTVNTKHLFSFKKLCTLYTPQKNLS